MLNNDIIPILINKLKKLNIKYDYKKLLILKNFLFLLKEYNLKFNLTRITENIDIINKHFIDSIYIMTKIVFDNKIILDFGTGAGFPGIPLSIMNKKSKFVLLDSNNKKINFINHAIIKLKLNNCITNQSRIEEHIKNKKFYDVIIARAVSNLFVISELAIPFLKLNGIFIAMKSIHSDEEIEKSKKHINKLGSIILDIHDYQIPDTDIQHRLIIIKKIKNTNCIYPRNYTKIINEAKVNIL